MIHAYNKTNLFLTPDGCEIIIFGMGCFWGAEKLFWGLNGVYTTSVGYSGGQTKEPTYEEVCSGKTNHAEVVRVVYNKKIISTFELLIKFWEGQDPTQGMRQGNDIGSQYRSVIIVSNLKQKEEALKSLNIYDKKLKSNGYEKITTEIKDFKNYYFAEKYHQQYLIKNPNGYCGLGGCGVKFK